MMEEHILPLSNITIKAYTQNCNYPTEKTFDIYISFIIKKKRKNDESLIAAQHTWILFNSF